MKRTAAIVDSRGEWLIRNGWGNYVAFIADPLIGSTLVLKDPCGSLRASARHMEPPSSSRRSRIAWRLGFASFTVNRAFVERRLCGGEMTQQWDALNEVTQIRRGECVEFAPQQPAIVSRRFLWNPFDFARSHAPWMTCRWRRRRCEYFALMHGSSGFVSRERAAASLGRPHHPSCLPACKSAALSASARVHAIQSKWSHGSATVGAHGVRIPAVSTSRQNRPLQESGSARFWKWHRPPSRSAR